MAAFNRTPTGELGVRPDRPGATSLGRASAGIPCPEGWDKAPGFLCPHRAEGEVPAVLTVTALVMGMLAESFAPEQADRIARVMADEPRRLRPMTRLALSDARQGSTAATHPADARAHEGDLIGPGFKGSLGEKVARDRRLKHRR